MFYRISIGLEPPFPACLKNKWGENDDYYSINNGLYPNTVYLPTQLYDEGLLTNFLSSGAGFNGLILTHTVQSVFNKYCLPPHKYFPLQIYHEQGDFLASYLLLNVWNIQFPFLKRWELAVIDTPLAPSFFGRAEQIEPYILKKLTTSNQQEAEQFAHDAYHVLKQSFLVTGLVFDKVLYQKYPLDFFYHMNLGGYIFSERLKLNLEQIDNLGATFHPIPMIILE